MIGLPYSEGVFQRQPRSPVGRLKMKILDLAEDLRAWRNDVEMTAVVHDHQIQSATDLSPATCLELSRSAIEPAGSHGFGAEMIYDLALFQELNQEYASKRVVPAPPRYDPTSLSSRADHRAVALMAALDMQGCRVLEIGCGRGETVKALAENYECEAVGVDISSHPEWSDVPNSVTLLKRDITDGADDLGEFDLICSYSVWEHLKHPYSMLKQVHRLLKPDGVAFIMANLYRGPKASHRYRDVFFPWPHLLFSDHVFAEYFESIGKPKGGASWVNRLSIADYQNYFRLLNFKVQDIRFSKTPFDQPFYDRFQDVLGRYPRYDLERDFMRVTLRKRGLTSEQTKSLPTLSLTELTKLAPPQTEVEAELARRQTLLLSQQAKALDAIRDTMRQFLAGAVIMRKFLIGAAIFGAVVLVVLLALYVVTVVR